MAIVVSETAKAKQIRLANEKKLSDLRSLISSENSDVTSISKELMSYSTDIRRASVFDLTLQLVESIVAVGAENLESIKVVTPESSKLLTKIITLKEEIQALRDANGGTIKKNSKDGNKYIKIWNEVKILNGKFESELRAQYDFTEALLNGLLLSTDIIHGYSESLTMCYDNNLVTKTQYNILRLLGYVRNLFMHNTSSYFMIRNLTIAQLYLFKAIILEARTVMHNLLIRHSLRMSALGAYIQAKNKLQNNETLTQEHIDMCHTLYAEMVLDDLMNKITYIKELYTKDELEKGYIDPEFKVKLPIK